MKITSITITLGELLNKCNDWNHACKILGLNPWCLNEGLAEKDDEITITLEQLQKIGLQWIVETWKYQEKRIAQMIPTGWYELPNQTVFKENDMYCSESGGKITFHPIGAKLIGKKVGWDCLGFFIRKKI